MINRRRQLHERYGFDFPEDFFRFWEFVKRLQPLDPLNALWESLRMSLVGPFEVLAGRFDRRKPRHSLLLHWRYYADPPEFFTLFAGDTDGLHWGYFLDSPPAGPRCVVSYYARDAFEMSVDGDDLFEAARLNLEMHWRTCDEYREEDPDYAEDYEEDLRQIDAVRERLVAWETGDRPETGDEYVEKYLGLAARNEQIVAQTPDGLGIVVPPAQYRRLSLSDKKLWAYLRKADDPAKVVEEARRALRDGFPGTALKLGKDLWAVGGERHTEYAYELLDAAYAALGREVLREVLRVHRQNRDLPSVDILENE
jgi:hypothetical protein